MKTASLHVLRNCSMALALAAGAALLPQAAAAGTVHRADFGGTWSYIGPTDQEHWHYVHRYYRAPIYVAPAYAYEPDFYAPDFYGPPPYDDYGPGIALATPGVGVTVD